MNGVTDVRYRVVSMLPGMRIIRLFYRMESPFITPAMARDWVAMIFLSLATTRIPTLIMTRFLILHLERNGEQRCSLCGTRQRC